MNGKSTFSRVENWQTLMKCPRGLVKKGIVCDFSLKTFSLFISLHRSLSLFISHILPLSLFVSLYLSINLYVNISPSLYCMPKSCPFLNSTHPIKNTEFLDTQFMYIFFFLFPCALCRSLSLTFSLSFFL